MIGKLKGLVEETGDDYIVVDVNGIGYVVYLSARALAALPGRGEAVALFIETQVREDAIRLFGFFAKSEQEWFRLLQSVQGVGAKVALAVLGTLKTQELANAIALRDSAVVARTPGVGKKVAERIVTELKNKAPAAMGGEGKGAGPEPVLNSAAQQPVADAVSALCNLGYSRDLAVSAIAAAVKSAGEEADSARLIRFGLRELAK